MENKHTPGPWRWEVNEKAKSVQLSGGIPTYDKTVMSFERWGMQSAQPNFMHSEDGLLGVSSFSVEVAGREHHSHWFKGIDHPDASLIAAAPDLLEAASKALENLHEVDHYDRETIDKLEAAIAKATGETPIDPIW